jgi:hypothetical protein
MRAAGRALFSMMAVPSERNEENEKEKGKKKKKENVEKY